MAETKTETELETKEEVVEKVESVGKPTYKAEILTTQDAQKKVQAARLKAPNVDPLEPPTRYKK